MSSLKIGIQIQHSSPRGVTIHIALDWGLSCLGSTTQFAPPIYVQVFCCDGGDIAVDARNENQAFGHCGSLAVRRVDAF